MRLAPILVLNGLRYHDSIHGPFSSRLSLESLSIWLNAWYSSMTRIPTFNILVLGLQQKTHSSIRGTMDPLFKTLYTVSMTPPSFTLQTYPFLFLSVVRLDQAAGLLCSLVFTLW